MKEKLNEVYASLKGLGKEYPDFAGAFHSFLEVSEKDGAVSAKNKELISIALSVATQCEWCIAFHVKNALEKGATKEEIMESCFVAVVMRGGPALMYMQPVIKALEEFSA